MQEDPCISNGKRGFSLRDEEDSNKENGFLRKKVRLQEDDLNVSVELVEEASHNWPQVDQ